MNIFVGPSRVAATAALVLAGIWAVLWLWGLAAALRRKDFDPVIRGIWVLVIILVPLFGVMLYWIVAPDAPAEVEGEEDERADDARYLREHNPR